MAVPLFALLLVWCLVPRPYLTGGDGVDNITFVAPAPPHVRVCVPSLYVPAQTAAVRLNVVSASTTRPALEMTLRLGGRTIVSKLAPAPAVLGQGANVDFPIPQTAAHPAATPASLCLSAGALVNWGGTALPAVGISPPTMGGVPMPARISIWYLPRPGSKRSYISRAGMIFARAALFRPGIVGPWTYAVILLLILPAIALLSLRAMALAVGRRIGRLGLWIFVIAAVNACCWALISPAFQAPDEVDHFAYTQSLVEQGQTPSPNPGSPLLRWSSAEGVALEGIGFGTDHQNGQGRPPWLKVEEQTYAKRRKQLRPAANNGGGYTTSAVHGPLYYYALAPAYLATRHDSVFSQLTLMRITSALIGALVALFAYLLARELAPGRAWLAVLAGLLVAYEPMYGFVSGIVNNDVGVNAAAAALELLLIRLLRRGITIPWGALTAAVLIALPNIKGTGLSLYPVAALVFAMGVWRYHSRRDLYGWAALAFTAVLIDKLAVVLLGGLRPSEATGAASAINSNSSAVNEALHNIPGYLSYLWQAFLPRLPFMAPHFPAGLHPGMVIFIERGWAAFGWYDVFFPHWIYLAIAAVVLAVFPLAAWAARREWRWVRAHWMEVLAVLLMPVVVIAGFEAAYYTPGARPLIAEFGRYAFPAIAPLALIAVGSLHAFGRRRMLYVGTGALVAMIFLSYAAQLLTLTAFYA